MPLCFDISITVELMRDAEEGFRTAAEIVPMRDSAAVARRRGQRTEALGEACENVGLEREVMELAGARNVNQTGGFELLNVMREGRRSDCESGERLRTAERAV